MYICMHVWYVRGTRYVRDVDIECNAGSVNHAVHEGNVCTAVEGLVCHVCPAGMQTSTLSYVCLHVGAYVCVRVSVWMEGWMQAFMHV